MFSSRAEAKTMRHTAHARVHPKTRRSCVLLKSGFAATRVQDQRAYWTLRCASTGRRPGFLAVAPLNPSIRVPVSSSVYRPQTPPRDERQHVARERTQEVGRNEPLIGTTRQVRAAGSAPSRAAQHGGAPAANAADLHR